MKTIPEIRPKIKLSLTRTDYILESIAIAGLLASWILPSVLFSTLPETIPTHIGLSGEIDGWGSKNQLFILPSISLLILIGLSILNKYPHTFNYLSKVTEENAHQLYTSGTRMLRIAKIIVVIVFFIIEWQICNLSEGPKLTCWLLSLIFIIPALVPIIMAFTLTKNLTSGKK
jgi:uncharacterized membrane protein